MSCKICGRYACTSSFHSAEEREEYEIKYGRYDDKIEELEDKIEDLEMEIELMRDELTCEQLEKIEKQLKEQK